MTPAKVDKEHLAQIPLKGRRHRTKSRGAKEGNRLS